MSPQTDQLPDFDAEWNYDRPAETERVFRAILQRTEQDAPLTYHLALLTQIGRAQGLQRRFADAHATLDVVQPQLGDDAVVPHIRYLLERGRAFNSSGKPERARPLFLDAWRLATDHAADVYAVDAAHMLGIVEPGEAGLTWNLRALDLAECSAQPRARRWRGSLYNNIGWTYHDAGQHERALAMFESALACREADGRPAEVRAARWAVARALRSLARTQEALERQSTLLHELEAAGAIDGFVHEEIGECLLALGQRDEARPHFARAFALLSNDPWLGEAEPDRLRRLQTLSGASPAPE